MLNPQALPFFHPRLPNYYFQTRPPPPPPFPSRNLPLPSLPCCLHGPAPPPPPPPPQLSPPAYYLSPYYTTYVCIHPSKPQPPPVENQRRQAWLPGCRTSAATRRRRETPLEFNEKSSRERRSTVMIRNIPNKLRRAVLLDLLDKHCAEQNMTATVDGGSPASEYDFVYLPMDFSNQRNLGYAFVNFTSPAAARRLYQSLQGYKWRDFGSTKVTHVCYARIQGKAALVEHFSKSWFHCISEEFLPVVLSPPRDGSVSLSTPTVLGRRVDFENSTNLKA